MGKIDTVAIKEQVDLLDLAERHTTLHKESAGESSGACPRCGGEDRFHVAEEWFFCRQCHPQRGDAIEFVRWLRPGLSFVEAVAQLIGNAVPPLTPELKRVVKPKPERKLQPAEWQQQATLEVDQAYERLWPTKGEPGPEGEPGRRYLHRRGLEAHTWDAFHIGYRADAPVPGTEGKQRAPAIVLPWYRRRQVVGVRYRFLEPQNGHRLTSKFGSDFTGLLFGGQALEFGPDDRAVLKLRSLVIVEGEINAMSCWQVASETNLDVLSLGSESAKLTPAMIAFATLYGHVLCWLDRPEVADAVASALPGAYSFSPRNGKDANDWLREGKLGGLISTAGLRACRDVGEKERLLWDLRDAADRLQAGSIDGGTAQVIGRLDKELGKAVRLCEPEPGRFITVR